MGPRNLGGRRGTGWTNPQDRGTSHTSHTPFLPRRHGPDGVDSLVYRTGVGRLQTNPSVDRSRTRAGRRPTSPGVTDGTGPWKAADDPTGPDPHGTRPQTGSFFAHPLRRGSFLVCPCLWRTSETWDPVPPPLRTPSHPRRPFAVDNCPEPARWTRVDAVPEGNT